MDGRHGFLGKMFSLFMNMDKMVGGDFERGLANLKRLVEAGRDRDNRPPSEPGAVAAGDR